MIAKPHMRAFGMGARPKLGLFLGLRDLVLGAGILWGQNAGAWVQARGSSPFSDSFSRQLGE
jgi:hypothetical protein